MIGLTLKHLRYLDALAKHQHFGRAAESCAITQPALSIQIRELEAMVDAPLVERSSRQVHLTALGEDFVARSRNILAAVDELGDVVRAARNTLTGRLRIGVIPTIAPYLLPAVAAALARDFEGMELQPREAITATLVEDLLAYRLDAALVALPISKPALEEFPLFEEQFVLVRQQSEAAQPVPSPQTLREMRLLLLEEGHCFRDQALAFCSVDGMQTRDVMEGSSLSTLVQMVGAGIGLTLIPEMAVPFETQRSDVCVARFRPPAPSRQIGMIWRKTNPLGPQLMQLKDIVGRLGREAVAAADDDIA